MMRYNVALTHCIFRIIREDEVWSVIFKMFKILFSDKFLMRDLKSLFHKKLKFLITLYDMSQIGQNHFASFLMTMFSFGMNKFLNHINNFSKNFRSSFLNMIHKISKFFFFSFIDNKSITILKK